MKKELELRGRRHGNHCSLILLVSAASAMVSVRTEAGPQRPWGLQDSTAVRYVMHELRAPYSTVLSDGDIHQINESPNREYFFFLTTGGDFEEDAVRTTLFVYSKEQTLEWLANRAEGKPPPSFRSATFLSRTADVQALVNPEWEEDSGAVVFQGISDAGRPDVFRLDIQSGTLEQLSRLESTRQQTFWTVSRGGGSLQVLYTINPAVPPPYPVEWVGRTEDGSILRNTTPSGQVSPQTVLTTYRGKINALTPGVSNVEAGWLSHDGTKAVIRAQEFGDQKGVSRPVFLLVDVQTGSASALGLAHSLGAVYPGTQTPMPESSAFWSADGRKVILVNAVDAGGKSISSSGEAGREDIIAEYDVQSSRWTRLEPLVTKSNGTTRSVTGAKWLKPGLELLVTYDTSTGKGGGSLYSLAGDAVSVRSISSLDEIVPPKENQKGSLSVRVDQSSNGPPKVVASDGMHEAVLFDPNPQLNRVHRQRTSEFRWRELGGQTVAGGLTLPTGYVKGARVPLVIHAYVYTTNIFLPDGHARPSDAVQALAARGMAVLELDIPPSRVEQDSAGDLFVQRIDAAVEELSRLEIVDPKHVGVTGFSAGGTNVLYAVTHPGRVPLAAAMAADFSTGSFSEQLARATHYALMAKGFNSEMDGSFWAEKANWLKWDPIFNADRVITPLLATRHGFVPYEKTQVRDELDPLRAVIGAFALNEKPFEYLYFGYSSHILMRPLEIIASKEAMIDWMAFWLQDFEDPNPRKVHQYRRWRPLREQQHRSIESVKPAPRTSIDQRAELVTP